MFTAEAEIREMFRLTGRGWVLVLEEGFRGTIHRDGIIESDKGSASYTGPEFADAISERKAWLSVIVSDARDLFSKGQAVRHYAPTG